MNESIEKLNSIEISLHFILDIMARTKTTPRMTTGPGHTPRPEPAIALNRDGTIKKDPAPVNRDPARERIKKMKREFLRAKQLMKEAQEIMARVEITFLDLEKTDFSDLQDLEKKD